MPLFLTVLEGETASTAETILATSDPDLIRRVATEISARLGVAPRPSVVLGLPGSPRPDRSEKRPEPRP
jgi:hypothetical protein